jgi:diadenosine tetraphosphatase ApaH/serine/threonine PP2A family protein phosphatase
MPIAGLISERILCMHGGLSPLMVNISEINSIKRPCDLRKQILASDLLWSDPDKKSKLFNFSNRGAGFLFGK